MADGVQFDTLEELCRFVADTLARLENLKAEHLKFSQEVLYRQGCPCGMYFHLYGPRELQLSALWETDSNSVLFYGSNGQRMQRTVLLAAPTHAASAITQAIIDHSGSGRVLRMPIHEAFSTRSPSRPDCSPGPDARP